MKEQNDADRREMIVMQVEESFGFCFGKMLV